MPNIENRFKMDSSASQLKEKDMMLHISNYNNIYYKLRRYSFTSFLCATYTKKCY